ncbi:MAG: Arc family DNA binding domain-containing protein [Bacteroidota bacterium]|nr:Arc family DNA binding domain-containing protein [Bacteroidota bacterium]
MAAKEKKPFALRLNKELMEAIEKWAADELRSTNGQIEWMLTKTLKEAGRLKKEKNADN